MTPNDERTALLQAILADPADDLPRLAYADWLDEYGGEAERARAESIRDRHPHVFRTGLTADGWWYAEGGGLSPARLVLHVRDLDAAGFAAFPDGCEVTFRRGFVAEVRAPLQLLLDHGVEVLRAHPVERLVATDKEPRGYAGYRYDLWCWSVALARRGERHEELRFWLPEEVYGLLGGFVGPDGGAGWNTDGASVYYPAEAAALDALSDALLAHLRPARLTGGGGRG